MNSIYVSHEAFAELRERLGARLDETLKNFGDERGLTLDLDALHRQCAEETREAFDRVLHFGFDVWPSSIADDDSGGPKPLPHRTSHGRVRRGLMAAAFALGFVMIGGLDLDGDGQADASAYAGSALTLVGAAFTPPQKEGW